MFSCADISKPTPPPAKPDDGLKSRRMQVTGRLKVALDNMVWAGMKRDDAAQAAGLTPHALYSALRKPHVKQWYLAECEILRTSGRARRIHRLEEIGEATSNLNASVQAIRTLDAPDAANSPGGSSGSPTTPGLTIQIITAPQTVALTAHERGMVAKPLISQEGNVLDQNVDDA